MVKIVQERKDYFRNVEGRWVDRSNKRKFAYLLMSRRT